MALLHFTLLGYAYPVSFLGALFEMDFHNLVRLSSILNLLDQKQSDMSYNKLACFVWQTIYVSIISI